MYLNPLITGALRQAYRQAPERKEALMQALHPTERGERGGRRYICKKCGQTGAYGEMQVDHIEPVVPIDREIENWDEYINRLYCGPSGLQVLHKKCHQEKTNNERELRHI